MRLIKRNGKIIAYVFDGQFDEGTHGVTDPSLPLQIISLKYPEGRVWPLHIHTPKERKTNYLLEALIVLKGALKVTLYYDQECIEEMTIGSGMGIMTLDGALQMEALEDVVMMEFKNGPFLEDKVILEHHV